MLVKFKNEYLEKLFVGEPIKGKPMYSDAVIIKFKKCILILKNVQNSFELSKLRGLRFEELKGDKKGIYSIRVDDGYRLEFRIEKDEIEIVHIEELSNHYK
jgi:proteic killer suppression protein